MNKTELIKLLNKYEQQTCTSKELDLLFSWIADESNESLISQVLLNELHVYNSPRIADEKTDFRKIFANIHTKIKENERKYNWIRPEKHLSRRSLLFIVKIAAILVFFFAAGSLSAYFWLNTPKPQNLAYNEIQVPFGSKAHVLLPDGSDVWLNAGSSIKYLKEFNTGDREVTLDGEAYFSVSKNTGLPFVVKTNNIHITALGTEFNVMAYNDEGIIEATLIEGKLVISDKESNTTNRKKKHEVFLMPNQKAVYVKKQKELRVEEIKNIKETRPMEQSPVQGKLYIASRVDIAPILAWKQNKLIFKSEELYNIAKTLERKYAVSIYFDTENIKHYKFSGTLEDETITQVLDVIKLTAPIDYKLNGKKVEIFENTHMKKRFIQHLKDIQ